MENYVKQEGGGVSTSPAAMKVAEASVIENIKEKSPVLRDSCTHKLPQLNRGTAVPTNYHSMNHFRPILFSYNRRAENRRSQVNFVRFSTLEDGHIHVDGRICRTKGCLAICGMNTFQGLVDSLL